MSPEYLALVEQYSNPQQQQSYASLPRTGPPPRRPQSAYTRQQHQLQQAYQNQRVPAIVPPRPRPTLHPQAEAQAEAQAEYQAQIDAQQRAEAQARLRGSATSPAEYQVPVNYQDAKLGTFEQELLQLVSANQAQEFKLQQAQESRPQRPYQQYSQQQVLAYSPEYAKPTAEPVQELPEQQQYHIETTQPRYPHQQVPVQYQPIEEAVQYQQPARPAYVAKKPYRPAPQSQQYIDPAHSQAEAEAIAQAQANAQAQALAFQKITSASHNQHQQNALAQIRIVEDRWKQESALEQINQGTQVSEAGKEHIEEQVRPKDPEAAYRARVKAQAAAEAAEARQAQEAAEYKAHGDAILALQKTQQVHLKAQEDAAYFAANFEKNQAKAQAQAQAIANAQALQLWKAHQANRANAQKEAQRAAHAQQEARKRDPEHTPAVQYLLESPNSTPLPSLNSFITPEIQHKYQASGSSYVPRATAKLDEQVNQPRQAYKHKVPANSQIYVSQSGLVKKAPVKSLTVEEIIEQDQVNNPQIIRIPAAKAQPLTRADIDALIQAGYTVTPVPDVARPTQPSYAESSTGYYVKKQSVTARPDNYAGYAGSDEQHQRRPVRKQRPILKQESETEGSAKITYLVPVESTYGNRRLTNQRRLAAEE